MSRFVWVLLSLAPLAAQERVDLAAINQIKNEAFENSKVMDHLSYMTDMYGPRLTGSPEFRQAADWALKRLQDYGLANGHLEKWGPFGRSWTLEKFSVELLEPRYSLMSAWPLAWSRSTDSPISGEPILAPMARAFDVKKAEADLQTYREKYKGKLRGKIVMLSAPIQDVLRSEMKPALSRYTAAELTELATAPQPVPKAAFDPDNIVIPDDPQERMRVMLSLPEDVVTKMYEQRQAITVKRNEFLAQEGVIAVLTDDQRAHDSLAFAEQAGSYKAKDALAPPTFVLTAEHYNRIARLIGKKAAIRIQVNLQAKVSDADVDGYNVVAEIPGGSKKDEVVMLGAHFDSWHSGTGATDNGSGSAVMMEVVRILKTLNLKMDRTVRIALWSGEEEGLLGSKAYVKEHFADPTTMKTTTAHGNFAGYFNLDNGSGKIRGVYLQNNDAMRPIFEQWLKPFEDLGVTTITIRKTGGTDHLSFDAVGLPGFQYIQDPLDYMTVTHHSNMDVYDHAIGADLMQASAVIASCVYEAATRPEKLPRKPLPKAKPAPSAGHPTE
jgi:carboxypeptidase Q